MNNRGAMLAVWSALFIFLAGMVIVNLIMPDVIDARTTLNCSSAGSISDGTKIVCLLVDIVVPYWILIVVSLTGGIILDRLLA